MQLLESITLHDPIVQIVGGIIIAVLGFVYYLLLREASPDYNKLRRRVIISCILIVLAHSVLDITILYKISQGNAIFISNFLIAVFHSLELFFFQTHLFDNGYQEQLFGTPASPEGLPHIVFLYVLLFVLAAITSCWILIRVLRRRSAGRIWLNKHKNDVVYVFFGGDKRGILLAKDLKQTNPNVKLLYIAEHDPETEKIGLSVWDFIKHRLLGSKVVNYENFDAVVFSKVVLKDVDVTNTQRDIYTQMGLKDLSTIMGNADCNVFLLSEDYDVNLHCTNILQQVGCKAPIYCRACREGVNKMYEEALSMTPGVTVHLVDESYLGVCSLKSQNEVLPVNFVDKGKNEGWVSSDFNSLILGFGELGQEALGFLYEFGAFVNKEFKKSTFTCTVMDRRMDELVSGFCVRYPGMKEGSEIHYRPCEIGSEQFWEYLKSEIKTLNYIVICLGDDRMNLNFASEILSFALRQDKDFSKNFAILIAQQDSDSLNEMTVRHLNSIPQYNSCVHSFGAFESVWRYNVINGSIIDEKAKEYYASYTRVSTGEDVDKEKIWKDREDKILNDTEYENRMALIRKRSQDYANVFHASTKLALLDREILNRRKEIAEQIPLKVDSNSEHYSGDDVQVKTVLHYLAVLEHIRWEASHIAMGYVAGEEKDEVKKIHNLITDFNKLDPTTQHYDYMVIKTTFMLY